MPRPKNVIPSVEKTVSLPEDLVLAVDLELFSEVEGKVPFGAWKAFLTRLVKEHLRRNEEVGKLTARLKFLSTCGDREQRHADMDRALAEYLAATGAHEASRIYSLTEKWYA